MRSGNWKYIHKVEPELYDVGSDPGELHNLASEHPEVEQRLLDDLWQLLASAPAPSTDAEASVDPLTEANLEALGYVTGGSRADPAALNSLEVHGPDPTALAPDLLDLAAAWSQRKAGKPQAALEMFLKLHERHPRSVPILDGYALQLETLEQANKRRPDSPDLYNDLAYALATTPDDTLRDGPRALRLAQRAVEQGGGNPSYLDTLACAYAETGDYANALASSDRALQMIEGEDHFAAMRAVLRQHREAAQARHPVRDVAPTRAPVAGATNTAK